ncbi:DUF962 domain-containing protein [Bdellovibrio sp. qaytius]|nr:DUF962 domain-containing protein [Bdellovibrio sp. qaytius]
MSRIKTYSEFWFFYLQEHSNSTNRKLHFIGTTLVIFFAILALVTANYLLFWFCPIAGYAFAWVGHFRIEHNRPATFKYPIWSLFSDFKMYFYFLSGKLDQEIEKSKAYKFNH